MQRMHCCQQGRSGQQGHLRTSQYAGCLGCGDVAHDPVRCNIRRPATCCVRSSSAERKERCSNPERHAVNRPHCKCHGAPIPCSPAPSSTGIASMARGEKEKLSTQGAKSCANPLVRVASDNVWEVEVSSIQRSRLGTVFSTLKWNDDTVRASCAVVGSDVCPYKCAE